MAKTDSRKVSARLGLLLALFIAVLYGLQVAGVLDLGLFDLAEPAPNQGIVSGDQDWIRVYFTQPNYPDEVSDHHGGLDETLAADIDRAQTSVDVAAYDFDLERVADALVAAHERGVRVRMVTDTDNVDLRPVRQLDRAGIAIVDDDRGAIMHNKFVVIDGQVVWTGSWNLTDNGTYRNDNNAVRVVAPRLAENYMAEFEEMFQDRAFGPTSPADTPHPQVRVATGEQGGATVLFENYFAPEDEVAARIVTLVENAERSVRFLAFSFTDDQLGDALKDQKKAGLEIQGVFEARGSDTEYSEYGRLRQARPSLDVLTDGNPYIMHHKVIILDDEIVILGSFNFTASADESNDENILVIHSPEVAALYRAEFDRIYAQAVEAQE
ncbi:MAG: phospholipase D-like domain-containing protein, partial [Anaerolineae bacterium]|jgi:phosphatidylserine/phosphatidylglycerophosphate/cardiolipin synthase-like enzyme